MGSKRGEPAEALLYPRVKVNVTEEHRNACGTKAQLELWGSAHCPLLGPSVAAHVEVTEHQGSLTCPVPLIMLLLPHQSQLAPNLPSALYLSQAEESAQPC